MNFSEKSFLDPKLLESVTLSFKIHSDLNINIVSSNAPVTLSALYPSLNNNLTIELRKKPDVLLKLLEERSIRSCVEAFAGRPKLVVLDLIKRRVKQRSASLILDPIIRDRFPSLDIGVLEPPEAVIDVEAYRQDFSTLLKEVTALRTSRDALQKDINRSDRFLNSSLSVDHIRYVYLNTKLNYARHASFHTKIRSSKSEYVFRTTELRKSLQGPAERRLQDVLEDLSFLKGLRESTAQQALDFMTDVSIKEQQHWQTRGACGRDQPLAANEKDSCEELTLELEKRAQSAAEKSLQRLEQTSRYVLTAGTATAKSGSTAAQKSVSFQSTKTSHIAQLSHAAAVPPPPSSAKAPPPSLPPPPPVGAPHAAETSGPDGSRDGESDLEQRSQYLSLHVAQLQKYSGPLLDGFCIEARQVMDRCLVAAIEAVRRKYGPTESATENAGLQGLLSRLEELRANSESVRAQHEAMRERLFDAHEQAVALSSSTLLKRRIAFLSKIKDQFDALQRAGKEERQRQKVEGMKALYESKEGSD